MTRANIIFDALPEKHSVDCGCIGKPAQSRIHDAASKGDTEEVILLSKTKPDDCLKKLDTLGRTPMMLACINGHAEVVKLLLDLGSPVCYHFKKETKIKTFKCNVLVEAIERRQEDVAMVIVENKKIADQALNYKMIEDTSSDVTPFRKLIKKMPAVAEKVLMHCSTPEPWDDCRDETRSKRSLKITFAYHYLEDGNMNTDCWSQLSRLCPCSQSKSTGTNNGKTKRSDHCILIMAANSEKSQKLLTHPLVTTLLFEKWQKFAQYFFFLNLFVHVIFVLLLTTFSILTLSPGSETCQSLIASIDLNSTKDFCEIESYNGQRIAVVVTGAFITIFSVISLLLELFQLLNLQLHYFLDWNNYLELILFTGSIAFSFVFKQECFCPTSWQWQVGAFCVFLAWIDLLLLIKMVPIIGIYVVMFQQIVFNFIKAAVLPLLLVLSFVFPFYMLFHDPSTVPGCSPFENAGKTFVRTVTMITGELGSEEIFCPNDFQYPAIVYPLWIVFLVLMPTLLNNLLTGLAVGDVNEIRANAEIRNLTLWANFILMIEKLLISFPFCCCAKFQVPPTKEIDPHEYPNKATNFFWRKTLNLHHFDTDGSILITPDIEKVAKMVNQLSKKCDAIEKILRDKILQKAPDWTCTPDHNGDSHDVTHV